MRPLLLIPELVPFKINTTYLSVQLEERESLPVFFDAQQLTESAKIELMKGNHILLDPSWIKIKMVFPIFAEVRYKMVNFFEWEYGNFLIQNEFFDLDKLTNTSSLLEYWAKNGIHPDPGFYQVQDSSMLEKKGKKYDPNNKLNLKHYIITGYDSYIEIIASSNYTFEVFSMR